MRNSVLLACFLLCAFLLGCALAFAEESPKPKPIPKAPFEEVRLTNNPVIDSDPAWSPDMTKIVFVSVSNQEGRANLHIMDADGANRRLLVDVRAESHAQPMFFPDGKRVLFIYNSGGNSEYAIVDVDGRNRRNLKTFGGRVFNAAMDPKGDSFVFVLGRNDTQVIYFYDLIDNAADKLFEAEFDCDLPVFSPDGKYLFYCEFNADGTNICRVNRDGENRKVLTSLDPEFGGDNICACPTSEGKVYYQTDVGEEIPQIHVMDSDGKNAKRAFTTEFSAINPVISPDGLRLAFIANIDIKKYELMLYTIATGKLERLTDNQFEEKRQQFSSDGKWLIYISDVVGNPELFKVQVAK